MNRVIFKRFDDGQIIAMFPEQKEKGARCASCMRHGQHAPADLALLKALPDATPAEAESLRRELAGIGYHLAPDLLTVTNYRHQ